MSFIEEIEETSSNFTNVQDCNNYLIRYKNHEEMINTMNYNISIIRFKLILSLENIYKFLANYYIEKHGLDINNNNNFKLLRGYISKHINNILNIDKKSEQRKYKCLLRVKFLINQQLIENIGELVEADLNITYVSEISHENFNVFVRTLGNSNEISCDVNEQFRILISNDSLNNNINRMVEN
jgi:hypothetical protein